MNSDYVFINDLELACRIGTTDDERAFPQVLSATIRIFLPLTAAGKTDSLTNTIDYAEIIQHIRTRVTERTYVLVEALAEDIAAIALHPQLAVAAEVTINKKVFEGIRFVGAHIRREKNTY